MEVNKLLTRQLKKLELNYSILPTMDVWQEFLKAINNTYQEIDKDRSFLERSMEISSKELLTLNDQLENAQHIARLGYWSYDNREHKSLWSKALYHMFGVDLTVFPFSYDGFREIVHERDWLTFKNLFETALTDKKDYECEIQIKNSDNIYRWYYVKGHVTVDNEERVTSVGNVIMDINKRKLAEQYLEDKSRELYERNQTILHQREQLIQSEKMASIGKLASGMAHEINNPISFCLSNLYSLQNYVKELSDFIKLQQELVENCFHSPIEKKLIKKIKKRYVEKEIAYTSLDSIDLIEETKDGLDRIKKIVAGMKVFARSSEEKMMPHDINQCIRDANRLTNNVYKYHCEMELNLAKDLPKVACLPDQITQVIINNITNSAQAVEKEGKIKITSKAVNDNVIIEVEDNGQGIPEEIRNKIFDPFFTTKAVGIGTGLGLAISFNIIDAHGGYVKVESEAGRGTKFIISLPIARESVNQKLNNLYYKRRDSDYKKNL